MKTKILVVDDCRTAIMMERMMFRGSEYEVLTASNGQEAVNVAVEAVPDLILMDVMMPVMNGFEAVREIRRHPALQDTPIIMVTTRGEAVNREEGLQAGCTDYMTKPFNAAELMERVRSHLDDKRQE